MTISNQTSSVTHNGNGLTTEWPFTFEIPTGALHVGLFDIATNVLTELVDTDYSVIGLDDPDGGEVTYPLVGPPITNAKRLVIWREVALTQDMDVTNQSPYYPEVLEDQLDRIVMMVQQLQEESNRAIKTTLGSSLTPDEFVEQLQEGAAEAQASADAAAASAAAALVSQNAAAASAVNALASENAAAASAADALASENAAATSETNAAASAAAAATSASNAATSETNAAASALEAANVVSDSVVGAVRVDVVQSFLAAEKAQGRSNIDAIAVVRIQQFTANGTYTPHADMVFCEVLCVGGGGGGGSYNVVIGTGLGAGGGGGGSGGWSKSFLSRADVLPDKAVVIGAGGASDTAGGTTSFGGTLVSATGGQPGATYSNGSYGGEGAGGGTGQIIGRGSCGQAGSYGITAAGGFGGGGGNSIFGGAARPVLAAASTSNTGIAAGVSSGSGGGGGAGHSGGATRAGGAGGSGLVYIIEYCTK